MSAADWKKAVAPALESFRGRVQEDAALAPFTWFRVGGPADYLLQPADEEDLSGLLAALPAEVPVHVLGLASNSLLRDGGIDGVVLRLSAKGFGAVEAKGDDHLRVGAALADRLVAKAALNAGIGGFAFYHGIPGSIGGALRMNAGANGVETRSRLVEAIAIDRRGNRHVLSNDDMGFGYRHSGVPSDYIFVEALFAGEPADPDQIRAEMDEVEAHRQTAQPVKARTGGSTFKNPPGHSAWELVDAAGCRGLVIGDAQVSEKHCNFLINRGEACARDIELLGETVRRRVRDGAGLELEWEIKRVGRFGEQGPVTPFLD